MTSLPTLIRIIFSRLTSNAAAAAADTYDRLEHKYVYYDDITLLLLYSQIQT